MCWWGAVERAGNRLVPTAWPMTRCRRERVEMSFNLSMYQPHLQGKRLRLHGVDGHLSSQQRYSAPGWFPTEAVPI